MSENQKKQLEAQINLLLDELHMFSVKLEEDCSLEYDQWQQYDKIISKLNLLLKEMQEEINFL